MKDGLFDTCFSLCLLVESTIITIERIESRTITNLDLQDRTCSLILILVCYSKGILQAILRSVIIKSCVEGMILSKMSEVGSIKSSSTPIVIRILCKIGTIEVYACLYRVCANKTIVSSSGIRLQVIPRFIYVTREKAHLIGKIQIPTY